MGLKRWNHSPSFEVSLLLTLILIKQSQQCECSSSFRYQIIWSTWKTINDVIKITQCSLTVWDRHNSAWAIRIYLSPDRMEKNDNRRRTQESYVCLVFGSRRCGIIFPSLCNTACLSVPRWCHPHTHKHTFRLVFDRGCAGSVNLQASGPSVSALTWGSGVSRDTPPEGGKIPKERGRSLLDGQQKKVGDHCSLKGTFHNSCLSWGFVNTCRSSTFRYFFLLLHWLPVY